jgi:hypothetical protein
MFTNVGGKIKTFAQVTAILGILGSVIGGLSLTSLDGTLGFLIIIAGSLIAWLTSLFLYGFGELVENTAKIESYLNRTGTGPFRRVN